MAVNHRRHVWGEWHANFILGFTLDAAGIRAEIAHGQFTVVGRTELHGRQAVELKINVPPSNEAPPHVTAARLWVDATTYLPRACSRWRSVSRHPAPMAWVVRTALNANISRWRRRRREVSVPDPGTVADLPAAYGASDSSVDPRIMTALMRLSPRQRQVVAMRLFLDLDTARTAQMLGIAPSSVKAHLARAIAALRDDLTRTRQQENSS